LDFRSVHAPAAPADTDPACLTLSGDTHHRLYLLLHEGSAYCRHSSPETAFMPSSLLMRLIQLVLGLFLYGIGIALMVRASIGVAPWDVLSQGIAAHSPLSFGLATNVIGAAVLLLWWPLRQKPGVGTVLNVLLIGPSAQVGLWLLPAVDTLWLQLPLFLSGLLLVAIATGFYIGARLGPGPRDGLMTGLHARTGWPIWQVRSLIEGSALLMGWLLGGDVGVGTLAFAMLIGPLCGVTLRWFGIGRPLPAAAAAPAAPR
jgi:uncharacterized membrane protein YczE